MPFPSRFDGLVANLILEIRAIQHSIQEQISAIRETAKTAHETQKEIPARLLDLRMPADLTAKADAYRKKAHGQQKWLTWGTWFAFVAAGVYAGIAFQQKKVMDCTFKEISKQTTYAERAAYFACVEAQLARNTLLEIQAGEQESHKATTAAIYQATAATQAEAAYIEIAADPHLVFGDQAGYSVTATNIGKTPARHVVMKFRSVFIPRKSDPDFVYPRDRSGYIETPIVPAGKSPKDLVSHPITYVFRGKDKMFATIRDLEDFRNSRYDMIFFARITYTDAFGIAHWRQFCQTGEQKTIADANTTHASCIRYNKDDTNAMLPGLEPPKKVAEIKEVDCPVPSK